METILNKTKFNKLFAILMAMFFALSFSFTRIHAIGQTDTVTVNVNIEAGDSVAIYKIIDVNYDFVTDQPQNPMYKWDSNVASWLKQNSTYQGYVADEQNTVSDTFKANKDNPEAFQGFLQELAAELKKGTIKNVTTSDQASAQLGMGEYLIVGTSNSTKIYLPTTIVVAPKFDEQSNTWKLAVSANNGVLTPDQGTNTYTVNLKGSTLTFDKLINAKDQGLVDMKTVGIGDTVHYVLKAAVPTYPTDSVNKTFVIADTAGAGLTLPTATDVKVYSDESLQNEIAQGFEKKVEGQNLTVTFTYDTLVQNSISTVYVAYTATVNSQAVNGTDPLKNTAKLTFAKDPYQANVNGEITDTEIVYTYGLDITKVAEDQNTALTGAQFTLKENDQELNFVKNTDGSYTLASAADQNTTTTLEVDGQGKLVLKGLDTGTYTLTETKPANGMVLPKNPVTTVTLVDGEPDGTLDINNTKVESSIVPNTDGNKPSISGNVLSFKVVNSNQANFELPNTGGMGTLAFTVGGILLMAGAVIYLLLTRKKEQK